MQTCSINRILPCKRYVLGFLVISSLFAVLPAHAAMFEWGTDDSWTGGDQSGGGSAVGGTNANVGVALNPGGVSGMTWTDGSPHVDISSISAGSSGENQVGLQLDGYFNQRWDGFTFNRTMADHVVVTVSFSQWVSGVSFSLYDIDRSDSMTGGRYNFVDSVSHISANSMEGVISPLDGALEPDPGDWDGVAKVTRGSSIEKITNGGIDYYYGNKVTNDKWDNLNTDMEDWETGMLTIDFGNNWISGFSFVYSGYTPNLAFAPPVQSSTLLEPNKRRQAIAMGDIHFTPVPETGTVAGVAIFLLGAAGFEYRRRRLCMDGGDG